MVQQGIYSGVWPVYRRAEVAFMFPLAGNILHAFRGLTDIGVGSCWFHGAGAKVFRLFCGRGRSGRVTARRD